MERCIKLIYLLSLVTLVFGSVKQVSVRDMKNQFLMTSSLLTWESFNQNDPQFEYAVTGGTFTGVDKYPAYICRSTINSVLVSGYVKKRPDKSYVCLISLHSELKTKGGHDFDILLNKGNGAKVEWVKWEKREAYQNIDKLVSTVNGGTKSDVYFIARHEKTDSMNHHEIDYAIGWLDPNDGLGKIHATVASSEHSFEDGELLVAIEPLSYEIHDMKFKKFKVLENVNRTVLGQTILENKADDEMDVNAVIGYTRNIVRNFGSLEGVARYVNATIYVNKGSPVNILWGIPTSETIIDSKSVGTRLQPGTALNVTLWGNYTTKEGPYDASLIIYWADKSKSKKRKVSVPIGLISDLEDQLEIEYSDTYWIHNLTIVPTTQRSTTTTSTTHRSAFPTSMSSNIIEKITEKSALNHGNHLEDDDDNEVEKNDPTGSASHLHFSAYIAVLIAFLSALYI